MGPSRVRDGDAGVSSDDLTSTKLLQWGRRVFATETWPSGLSGARRPRASMGPSRVRDGDFRSFRGRAGARSRFNGAVACSRRRQRDHARPIALLIASMGPSRVRDGDCRSRSRPCSARPCFNGAVACSRRRPLRIDHRHLGATGASMGPSRVRDGDSSSVTPSERSRKLQWGRRVFATETRGACRRGSRLPSFNGAVACSRRRRV